MRKRLGSRAFDKVTENKFKRNKNGNMDMLLFSSFFFKFMPPI